MREAGNGPTLITDYRHAAAALAIGATLVDARQEPNQDRMIFLFEGLPSTFLSDVINGKLSVVARDFIAGLEHIQALLAQFRARSRAQRS